MAIALPGLGIAVLGMALLWRQTDQAVRTANQRDAEGFAAFLATAFATTEEARPSTPPRVAHRAVTHALRSNWSALRHVADVRILNRAGVVRWSRAIEEEDRLSPDRERLLAAPGVSVRFEGAGTPWPWSRAGWGEVVVPLGGVACGECHGGESTLRTGVLQLTVDESSLRREMAQVFSSALGSVVFFGLALSAAVALSLHVFLRRPLARLAGVMQRAEAGEWVVRAPAMGTDEIGRLAQAFNRMLAKLTEFKVSEIDQQRDLDRVNAELALKGEVERLNAHLNVRIEELQILYDLARTINSTLELSEVLERVTSGVPRFDVPKFSIMLLNAEGALEVKKAHPPQRGSEGLTFGIGEGICGHAALTRKSVYVADLETTLLFRVRGELGAAGRGCLLAVPLLHGGELFGVLNFERTQKADFSADEIEFFTAVTDQVAMAVANARLHAQTVALSVTDPLTGIPNRRFLFQQLEAEINRARRFQFPLSVLMIDIDHFKRLNDSAGHSAGDEVLREVSRLLHASVRKIDTLARYGGEEFAVLLPRADRKEASEVAEKLRRAVAEAPIQHAQQQPLGAITISVGAATLPLDATSQANLMDCADAALYASKRSGRNTVRAFEPGMEDHPGRERGPLGAKPAT